jgi:hypothetical protein
MEDKKIKTESRRGGSSSTTGVQVLDPFWKRVWNLKCPKR